MSPPELLVLAAALAAQCFAWLCVTVAGLEHETSTLVLYHYDGVVCCFYGGIVKRVLLPQNLARFLDSFLPLLATLAHSILVCGQGRQNDLSHHGCQMYVAKHGYQINEHCHGHFDVALIFVPDESFPFLK